MKTHKLTNNHGIEVEVLSGLKLGDIVTCTRTHMGLCDGGTTTMLFTGHLLTEGDNYKVCHIAQWDFKDAPYVTNDDGALTWVTAADFKLAK